ncbi:lysostaphin resistance A-like protein [Agathobacter rectalis]|uniref:lysostaphin resistance A-like protein n=1 Tax=Agathobacter rectalis TaxID=39491 RepID=UPI003FD6CEBF
MAPKSYQIAHIYCLFFLMVVVCIANRDTDNTVKASKFNKDIYINLAKNEEYKEMKKENNYISTDMNHKKLIFGVVIIHICFLIIKSSGITDILKEKNIFYGVLINMIYQSTLIIMIGVAMKQYLITSFKKFKADRISVNIKRVLAGVGIAFLLSCIAGIIEMTVCSNISVPANQSNVNGYFVDYPILAVIMSVIMAPFTEEIIYRGILFRFFSKYGELCAVLVTGFLFGTMHMLSSFGNANILLFLCQWLDYFLSGIFLGFIYKKYKNIWTNISIHGTWNLIGAVMILTKIMLTK